MPIPWHGVVNKIDDCRWEIPQSYKTGMLVPGLIFASEAMLNHIWQEQVFQQVANVAFLPGIVGHSLAMPDIHWGYGFPIGGVAATRVKDGVISPGGVGFDINCGVRLLRTNLTCKIIRRGSEKIWHKSARPPACLRPDRLSRRTGLFASYGVCCQLCLD